MRSQAGVERGPVAPRRGREEGFALVIVMIALLMLSVLGALSLLVMVSSLRGVANLKPEDRAFQVAEAALHVAHSKIVNNEVQVGPVSGQILGGDYTIEIRPIGSSTTDYTVTSEGSYVNGGNTYRRKIQERVSYSGMQAFDVMRKYLLFANRDINITLDDAINLNVPVTVYGSIRAERNVNIMNRPTFSLGDGLTFNGDVEGVQKVYVESNPGFLGTLNTRIVGNVRTGRKGGATAGTIDLYATRGLIELGRIYTGNLYCSSLTTRGGGVISYGTRYNEPGCEPVYVPEPDFAYYKALAQEQHRSTGKNYVVGNLNLNGRNIAEFVPTGSSVAVIYATGDINLRGFRWNQNNVKATFVCEGNFTSTETFTALYNLQCQVITKGNATFTNRWSFPQIVREDTAFFVWAGGNATINMGMWSGNSLQVTAMNDINVNSNNLFDYCWVRYRPPDIDVAGFPIDITIRDWRELPSEGT